MVYIIGILPIGEQWNRSGGRRAAGGTFMRKLGSRIGAAALCACLTGVSGFSGCEKRAPAPDEGGGAPATPETPAGGAGTSGLSPGAGLKKTPKYEVVEASSDQVGTLAVAAVYATEEIPGQSEVPVNIDVEYCSHKVVTENLIVDRETRGLKNVVVRLEGISRGSRKPPETVEILNKGCAFVPHVSVAVKGTRILIRNEDPVFHTTHPYINGRHFFNVPLQKKGQEGDASRPRPLMTPGLLELNCDVHKWMRGYTVIHTNPYLAVTDAKGKIELGEIPPGEYPYVAWHEQLGEKRGTVTIEAGATAELRLEFELAQ